jgi:hypothetical protein
VFATTYVALQRETPKLKTSRGFDFLHAATHETRRHVAI